MSRRERKSASIGDMIRTLGVFALLIGLTLAFLPRKHHDKVRPVEYVTELSIFSRAAGFVALAPSPMPTGWNVTSFTATVRGASSANSSMRMGVVTADTHYVELHVSDLNLDALVSQQLGPSTEGGLSTINGKPWKVLTTAKGVYALVRHEANVTTLIFGGVNPKGAGTEREVTELASSLKPL